MSYVQKYPRSTSVWPAHNPYPACSGPCDQGRVACPHPDACRIAEDGDCTDLQAWRGMAVSMVIGALAWGALIFAAGLFIHMAQA